MKKTQSTKTRPQNSRRSFLRKSVAVGGGVAAATTIPGEALAAESIPEAKAGSDGYRVTEHIAEYYKSAKL